MCILPAQSPIASSASGDLIPSCGLSGHLHSCVHTHYIMGTHTHNKNETNFLNMYLCVLGHLPQCMSHGLAVKVRGQLTDVSSSTTWGPGMELRERTTKPSWLLTVVFFFYFFFSRQGFSAALEPVLAVDQTGLELTEILPLPPECWD